MNAYSERKNQKRKSWFICSGKCCKVLQKTMGRMNVVKLAQQMGRVIAKFIQNSGEYEEEDV
jgi:hypothetical protein